jgi:hypothetical protein
MNRPYSCPTSRGSSTAVATPSFSRGLLHPHASEAGERTRRLCWSATPERRPRLLVVGADHLPPFSLRLAPSAAEPSARRHLRVQCGSGTATTRRYSDVEQVGGVIARDSRAWLPTWTVRRSRHSHHGLQPAVLAIHRHSQTVAAARLGRRRIASLTRRAIRLRTNCSLAARTSRWRCLRGS